MGSYPRYAYRFDWRGLFTPAIKTLLIANAAVFLLQTLVRLLGGPVPYLWLMVHFGLVPSLVTHEFHVWQPFTYLFLHGDLWHLLLNMLVLWMFGRDLEVAWGRRRFYFYFFLTGVGAGLINILVKTVPLLWGAEPSITATIGASGAIYGILLAVAMVYPDRQIWLIPFPIMLPIRVFVLIIGAIAFFSTLSSSADGISHLSHLGGMLVGYVYLRRGSFFYGLRNSYADWHRRRLRRKFDVYMRDTRDEPPSRPDHWVN